MNKRKIGLSIFLILLLLLIVLCIRQWNNINAARYTLTLDKETVAERIAENEAQLDRIVEEYGLSSYVPTDVLSTEPATDTPAASENPDDTVPATDSAAAAAPAEPAPPTVSAVTSAPVESEPDYDALIGEQIAKLYSLRATFVARLQEIVDQAVFDYALSEDFTYEGRVNAVSGHLDAVAALEKECDAEVARVVDELRRLLRAAGRDDALAKQAEDVYKEEKSLKKAYYLKELTG